MKYSVFFFRILLLIVIPIIVRYILKATKEKKMDMTSDLIVIEFSSIFKLISLSALFMSIGLAVTEYQKNGIIDMIIVSPLVVMFLFSCLYFCAIKITLKKNSDYFVYRNIIFKKEKVYYRDIEYAQIKKNTLFIFLKNGRKKMIDTYIIGLESLFSCFCKNKVPVKKKI